MKHYFPPQGVILIPTEVTGPGGTGILRLIPDTGATNTVISERMLASLGYDLTLLPRQRPVTTASGTVFVATVPLLQLTALGVERTAFPVLSHTLPPSSPGDGLLGLDFFRGRVLTLDFPAGQVTLR